MHATLILAIGLAIVLVGILVFRLHAFLTLALAALVVALLTPQKALLQHRLAKTSVRIESVQGKSVLLQASGVEAGARYLLLRPSEKQPLEQCGELQVEPAEQWPSGAAGSTPSKLASAVILGTAPSDLLAADVLVVTPGNYRTALAAAGSTAGARVAAAFGATCGRIGILIALAAIIGKCLLDSGGADRIVRSALRLVGQRGAPFAFLSAGFLLGIPVFFDTVFYLMIPLGKAMRLRTGRNYLLYVLTIICGATMAHSLVPPTPGPLLVAEALNVDMGLMIGMGCVVGLCASSVGYVFALWANRRMEVPLRESVDFSVSDLEAIVRRDVRDLPPLWLALLPIVLPVVLIAGYAVFDEWAGWPAGRAARILATLGDKDIAMALAAAIAMFMLAWQKRQSVRQLIQATEAALASSGVIILITSAGGAFGEMLQQTGVAGLLAQLPQYSSAAILTLAFVITAAIRTAQGSATVAMITAVGVLSAFAAEGRLGCHPVYLAMAIGCGSKPVSWMNDSGFWVICKMSGMSETEGLRTVSPLTVLMGIAGLVATLILASVWPLT